MPAKYRKKPITIMAEQWTGENLEEIRDFIGDDLVKKDGETLLVDTLEGIMYAHKGWYVIEGIEGEHYPIEPKIFNDTYEKVDH